MKRKTRTITVNNKQYVWWYELGSETTINLSPINDKTSIISIYFPLNAIENHYDKPYSDFDVFNETVVMNKDDEEYNIKIISPKMAALILSNLSFHEFTTRKHIFYNGFELLSKWNFTISEVVVGVYW